MEYKNFKLISYLLGIAAALFALHQLFFFIFGKPEMANSFHYPLLKVYGFFLLCSVLIIFILIIVKEKSINNVGYAFLFLTCIKMLAAYIFLRPILLSGGKYMGTEKLNFFIVFALFLAIETVLTIRILNKP